MFMCIIMQEDQIARKRTQYSIKLQELAETIQDKLEHAENRKYDIEYELRKRLRYQVSTWKLFILSNRYVLKILAVLFFC